jgi:hypothetical protein
MRMKKLRNYLLIILYIRVYLLTIPVTLLRFCYPRWYDNIVSRFNKWIYRNVLR